MSVNAGSEGSRRNRTWDELPPHRRRFWGWLFVLLLLIAPIARFLLQLLGVSSFAASMIVLAILVLVLVPLGRAAWRELKQRRASGEDIPPRISGRVVIAWFIAAALLWAVFASLVVSQGPLVALLPLFVTATAIWRLSQWHGQRA